MVHGLWSYSCIFAPMKVFKFGGASVSTAERIRNVAKILNQYQNDSLLVVVSAIGKTTNALEKVVEAFYAKDKESALRLFEGIKKNHLDLMQELSSSNGSGTDYAHQLKDFFTE